MQVFQISEWWLLNGVAFEHFPFKVVLMVLFTWLRPSPFSTFIFYSSYSSFYSSCVATQVRLALFQEFARTKQETSCFCCQVKSQRVKDRLGQVPIKSQTQIFVTEIWFKFESQVSISVKYNVKHSDLLCCAAGGILLVGWRSFIQDTNKQGILDLLVSVWADMLSQMHGCTESQGLEADLNFPFSVVQNDLQFSQMNDFQEKEEIKCFQSLSSRGFYPADFSLLGLTIKQCFMWSLALPELKVSADMKY